MRNIVSNRSAVNAAGVTANRRMAPGAYPKVTTGVHRACGVIADGGGGHGR